MQTIVPGRSRRIPLLIAIVVSRYVGSKRENRGHVGLRDTGRVIPYEHGNNIAPYSAYSY